MGKEELIEKLKQSINPEGLFTISGGSSVNQMNDADLSKEDRVNIAIERFENSLDNKPKEATKVYLVL
jgi:hypothetical protein